VPEEFLNQHAWNKHSIFASSEIILMTNKRIALITGATSGIGEATARLLSQHQFNLIICGRRKDRLDKLADELRKSTEVTTRSIDVRHQPKVADAIATLPDDWKNIEVLINNAGNAHGLDPIQTGKLEDWDAMIDINVKGLLYVTKEVLPVMVKRNSGHIINIGSIAGKEVYANGNVYCASKFAVDAITKGMRIDLNAHNIKVTGIHPGLVDTEFSLVRFKGDAGRASTVYKGLEPLHAQDIADLILFVLTRPHHVMIADLTVFPTAQASATVVKRNP
jgi:3-hydroxy acid dehydrogenase / malonic semialdehyde reductase